MARRELGLAIALTAASLTIGAVGSLAHHPQLVVKARDIGDDQVAEVVIRNLSLKTARVWIDPVGCGKSNVPLNSRLVPFEAVTAEVPLIKGDPHFVKVVWSFGSTLRETRSLVR